MKKSSFDRIAGNRMQKRNALKTSDAKFFDMESKKIFNEERSIIGIHSTSTNNTDSRMWGHYADKHRGFCVGFDFSKILKPNEAIFFHINYAKEIKPMKYFTESEDKNRIAFFYWLFTKSHIWEYENEVRMLRLSSHGLVPFNPEIVTEVYFGITTPPEQMREINSLVKHSPFKNVRTFKMCIDKQKFDLGFKKYKP